MCLPSQGEEGKAGENGLARRALSWRGNLLSPLVRPNHRPMSRQKLSLDNANEGQAVCMDCVYVRTIHWRSPVGHVSGCAESVFLLPKGPKQAWGFGDSMRGRDTLRTPRGSKGAIARESVEWASMRRTDHSSSSSVRRGKFVRERSRSV